MSHNRIRQAIGLLDLTSLDGDENLLKIADLCRRACTPLGPVAAVCTWAPFVKFAKQSLEGSSIRVAAVANFPDGATDIARAVAETREIVEAGGDEVDLVFPWRLWLASGGTTKAGAELVSACRETCGERVKLKVILETGAIVNRGLVRAAALTAIEAGADFLKTSTGKTPVSATRQAVETLLEAVRISGSTRCGVKVSGGLRDAATAFGYLEMAERAMGKGWVTPDRFRFGASKLLDALLASRIAEAGDVPPDGLSEY
jgi:deoxyribose-phosphate aldolase